MSNTRAYRLRSLELSIELEESAHRRALNTIARDDALQAATLEATELLSMFAANRPAAWLRLAQLTPHQRIELAIDVACHLESVGIVAAWGDICDRWEAALAAKRAA